MSLFSVGRMAMKIAGRDAGRRCVVVQVVDGTYVVVDGNVRRKKVNVKHLEPIAQTLELKDNASHDDVKAAFSKVGLPVWDKKSKSPKARPVKQKKKRQAKPAAKVTKEKAPPKEAKVVETKPSEKKE